MVKWDGRGVGVFVLSTAHSSVLPSGDTLSASMHALSLFSVLCTSRPKAPENDCPCACCALFLSSWTSVCCGTVVLKSVRDNDLEKSIFLTFYYVENDRCG